MGTRADFYVGRGKDAEWIGSIAFDGYPDGIESNLLACTDEQIYRDFVKLFLDNRDDSTLPSDGWPWPWNDSCTTDYAYAFDDDKVYASCFGHKWFIPSEQDDISDEEYDEGEVAIFPDMSEIQNITLGKRSGMMFVTVKGK